MRTWTLLLAVLLLAGCMDDNEDDDAELSTASVSADGDPQDTVDCADGDATITGSGSVDEGTATFTVTDGDGNEVWSETYSDAFELEGETVDGAGGTWTVEATTSDGFDGGFGLNVSCS